MVNNSDYVFLGIGCGFFVVMGFTSFYFIDVVEFIRSRVNSKFYMQKNESERNEN